MSEILWKPISQRMLRNWGQDENGFREFVSTFGFNKYARCGGRTVIRAGAFLQCERGATPGTTWTGIPDFDTPPCLEHSLVFHKTGTKRRMWVYHPYLPWYSGETVEGFVQELETWCNERDIIYMFCPQSKSFYYPGKSYMVMLMSNDTYIDCLSIPGFPQNFEDEGDIQ